MPVNVQFHQFCYTYYRVHAHIASLSDRLYQGRLQRGKWTQLASSLAQGGGGEFHPQGGKNSPRCMGHIDDCIESNCY